MYFISYLHVSKDLTHTCWVLSCVRKLSVEYCIMNVLTLLYIIAVKTKRNVDCLTGRTVSNYFLRQIWYRNNTLERCLEQLEQSERTFKCWGDWSENQFLAFLKAFGINDYLVGTTWNRRRTTTKEFEIIYELRAISRKFHWPYEKEISIKFIWRWWNYVRFSEWISQ